MIADLDSILNTMKETPIKNNIRCELVNTITNYMNSPVLTASNTHSFMHSCFNQTKVFLKANSDLLVLTADKGNRTVIMNKTDYDVKMKALLDDTATYKTLNKDPTLKTPPTNNRLAKSWCECGYISSREKIL